MLPLIAVLAALVAAPGAAADSAGTQAKRPAVANPFTRKPCAIYYYHYNLKGLHVAGGYSHNLPLQVFTEPETARPERPEKASKFAMPLLPDLNIGFQSQGNAFFLDWRKNLRRPRVQLYFKLWI